MRGMHHPSVLCWGLLGFLLLYLSSAAWGQSSVCPEHGNGLEPVDYQNVTVSSTPVGFSADTIASKTAAAAYMTLEEAPVRYMLFGVPTSTDGHLVDPPSGGNAPVGGGTWICGRMALLGFRAIRSSNADAVLHVTLFRQRW